MRRFLSAGLFILAGCAWSAAEDTGCRVMGPPHRLPDALDESSGVAWSLARSGVLWTHNDGGDPRLFAIDRQGSLLATIRVEGGSLRDWEDLATARCGEESCIYLSDTGDNQEIRPGIQLLRVRDQGELEDGRWQAQVFPMVLPDGPRDIEAMFVLPGEQVFFVTKGRSHPNTVYRYPPPLRPGEPVTLEEVQTLSDGPMPIPAQITGGDAAPDGNLVVIRSYRDLVFYRVENGLLEPLEGGRVALRTLEEPQGEGVSFSPGRDLFLTTEGGSFGGVASIRVMECQILR